MTHGRKLAGPPHEGRLLNNEDDNSAEEEEEEHKTKIKM